MFLGGPAVALAPVVASDPAVGGILAAASVPADPVVPILAGVFTYFPPSCTVRHFILSDCGYLTVFFCNRTIGISNTGMMKSRNYHTIGSRPHLSDSGIPDSDDNYLDKHKLHRWL